MLKNVQLWKDYDNFLNLYTFEKKTAILIHMENL